MIHFFRSYYGPTYYFDYYFFLGDFEKSTDINQESVETYTPCVGSRFYFMKKISTHAITWIMMKKN